MTRSADRIETPFTVHTLDTAPEDSRGMLKKVKAKYGFVPNLLGELAESPPALEAYLGLGERLAEGRFSEVEQQVLLLSISMANSCGYCVAAHSAGAAGVGVEDRIVAAIRNDSPLADPQLEILRRIAQSIVRERGWIDDALVQEFLDAGYTRAHLLDLLVAVAMKTLSNYTNHIADTSLDPQLGRFAFESA